MDIRAFPSGPFATNAYVVACPETFKAAIIDPGLDSAPAIVQYLTQMSLKPIAILLTHTHWDHTANVAELKRRYGIPVMVHPLDAPNLREPGSDGLPCWVTVEPVEPDRLLEEGESVEIGNLSFTVIHTPGHSPGGICLYNVKQNVLLSGDTLFKGTIGNISFPTANADAMWQSLKKLERLPAKTTVYPGHGPHTTLKEETWLPEARKIFGSYS